MSSPLNFRLICLDNRLKTLLKRSQIHLYRYVASFFEIGGGGEGEGGRLIKKVLTSKKMILYILSKQLGGKSMITSIHFLKNVNVRCFQQEKVGD